MERVVHLQLAKVGPSSIKLLENAGHLGQKYIFFILLGLNEIKMLSKNLYLFIFCSERAFQRYTNNDNPSVASNMAIKTFSLPLIFGQIIVHHMADDLQT